MVPTFRIFAARTIVIVSDQGSMVLWLDRLLAELEGLGSCPAESNKSKATLAVLPGAIIDSNKNNHGRKILQHEKI